jgi:hypothetical protein
VTVTATVHQAEKKYCRSGLHRHQAPSPGHKAWGSRVQGSGAQCFCGNCGAILRTEADVAGSARAYDFQLRKEQMFLWPGAAVSFASREVVRSPSESCPRLARPCTDRQWSPRIRRSQSLFASRGTVRTRESELGRACILKPRGAPQPLVARKSQARAPSLTG